MTFPATPYAEVMSGGQAEPSGLACADSLKAEREKAMSVVVPMRNQIIVSSEVDDDGEFLIFVSMMKATDSGFEYESVEFSKQDALAIAKAIAEEAGFDASFECKPSCSPMFVVSRD